MVRSHRFGRGAGLATTVVDVDAERLRGGRACPSCGAVRVGERCWSSPTRGVDRCRRPTWGAARRRRGSMVVGRWAQAIGVDRPCHWRRRTRGSRRRDGVKRRGRHRCASLGSARARCCSMAASWSGSASAEPAMACACKASVYRSHPSDRSPTACAGETARRSAASGGDARRLAPEWLAEAFAAAGRR